MSFLDDTGPGIDENWLKCFECGRTGPDVVTVGPDKIVCSDCDLDAYEKFHRAAAREALDDYGGGYNGRIMDLGAVLSRPDEEIPWRCESFAADGYLTVLAGRGGEGKSWLALSLAAAVGRGGSAAGIPCRKGRGLIFDAENGPKLIARRFRAAGIGADAGLQPVDAGGLRVTKRQDMEWIREVIHGHRPNLVVFDSLRVLSSGSKESDGDAMEPIVTALKQLARDTGAAVVLIHHRGKGDSAYRGSSVILDQTDLLFTLGRVDGDPDSRTRRKLTAEKCRIDEEPTPRWMKIEADRSRGLVFVNEADPFEGSEGAPRDVLRDDVLEALGGIHRSARSVAKAIGRKPNDGTTRRVLDDLAREGLVVRHPDGWTRAARVRPGATRPAKPARDRPKRPAALPRKRPDTPNDVLHRDSRDDHHRNPPRTATSPDS